MCASVLYMSVYINIGQRACMSSLADISLHVHMCIYASLLVIRHKVSLFIVRYVLLAGYYSLHICQLLCVIITSMVHVM